ncbi:very-long-chain (3R)-3-hydroxyacyl-CoA dehydratase 3 [Eurytemora carolleeae]|uniref:very-long-chain (3R)-3-hydroxyacyl-CoA dehydratase 3 n=1 Tax=Eurytemora carolleeae TaxID=1294199 RepID=UPI000C782F38|nr:very-long-chain (3R)-3-hydroxyacyl-CoA dehydratase 3 [Eurytemora carolleeae]|eukprot:XP_023334736.1 very-long-chain (3R)-3-hydroxyacyl-CoA dehydratase 3-like [Eurytemora affinis]
MEKTNNSSCLSQSTKFSHHPLNSKRRERIPHVKWYQRENFIHLTLEISNCKTPEIRLDADNLVFRGQGNPDMLFYELNITFLHPVNLQKTNYSIHSRVVELKFEKSIPSWWTRLVKPKEHQHWLRIDFQNWKDEDETEEETNKSERENYRQNTSGWSKHIAENIAKGSHLCPLGISVMSGSMTKEKGLPTIHQESGLTGINVYNYCTTYQDSDNEFISDLEED